MEAEDEILLPSYKGSTFRGAFGMQFKKVVCALRKEHCRTCLLRQKCIYAYVFESPSPEEDNVLGRVNSIPHPFVIEPPEETKQRYISGQTFSIGLVLVGEAIQYLPYFIYTFDQLGKNGIGRGRGRCALQKVHADGPQGEIKLIYCSGTGKIESFHRECIELSQPAMQVLQEDVSNGAYTVPGEITLRFLTPTRLKYEGKLATDPEFHIFIRQLLRRLFLLRHYYCKDSQGDDTSATEGYHRMLIEEARTVKIKESNFKWHDWERYSRRQDTRMKLGGFQGDIVYKGALAPFYPFLKAGEILHIGKGTSFGLGKYVIGTYHELAR